MLQNNTENIHESHFKVPQNQHTLSMLGALLNSTNMDMAL